MTSHSTLSVTTKKATRTRLPRSNKIQAVYPLKHVVTVDQLPMLWLVNVNNATASELIPWASLLTTALIRRSHCMGVPAKAYNGHRSFMTVTRTNPMLTRMHGAFSEIPAPRIHPMTIPLKPPVVDTFYVALVSFVVALQHRNHTTRHCAAVRLPPVRHNRSRQTTTNTQRCLNTRRYIRNPIILCSPLEVHRYEVSQPSAPALLLLTKMLLGSSTFKNCYVAKNDINHRSSKHSYSFKYRNIEMTRRLGPIFFVRTSLKINVGAS